MKILVTPDPFLRRTAQPVASWDKKTFEEVSEMVKLLREAKDPEGVGLAATQVGIDKRLFVLMDQDKPHIYINPVITYVSRKMLGDVHRRSSQRWLEGCLSIPRIWGFVDRPYTIKVTYQTPESLTPDSKLVQKNAELEDMDAAYFQHERDHLDGILFTDHILKQGGKIFQEDGNKLRELELVG